MKKSGSFSRANTNVTQKTHLHFLITTFAVVSRSLSSIYLLTFFHCCTVVPCLSILFSCNFSMDRKRGQRKGATSKNVKNRQKVSDIFSTLFDIFRAGKTKNVKHRQKVSKIISTLFDIFRAAPVFRPLLGGSCNIARSTSYNLMVDLQGNDRVVNMVKVHKGLRWWSANEDRQLS